MNRYACYRLAGHAAIHKNAIAPINCGLALKAEKAIIRRKFEKLPP